MVKMSIEKSKTRADLLPKAFMHFLEFGFYGTSMDDLVKTTGYSRSSIYYEYKSKKGLFEASLLFFNDVFLKEPVGYLEEPDATLDNLQQYFDWLLDKLRTQTPPYKGCFIANTMNESSPHDKDFRDIVNAFNDRLSSALCQILCNETKDRKIPRKKLKAMARYLMTSIYGIWTFSRSVSDIKDLEDIITAFMSNIKVMVREI